MANLEFDWEQIARQMCFENEYDMLNTLYQRSSIAEIATILKCGTATVHARLSRYKIKKRARGGAQSSGAQKYKLFHVDQRLIMFMGLTHCAKFLRVSNSTLHKYKRQKAGGTNKGYYTNATGESNYDDYVPNEKQRGGQ